MVFTSLVAAGSLSAWMRGAAGAVSISPQFGSGGFMPNDVFVPIMRHQHDKITVPAIFPVVECRGHGERKLGFSI